MLGSMLVKYELEIWSNPTESSLPHGEWQQVILSGFYFFDYFAWGLHRSDFDFVASIDFYLKDHHDFLDFKGHAFLSIPAFIDL